MLFAEWYANDGDAKQYAKTNVGKRCIQAAAQYPDYVEENSKATAGTACIYYTAAKRPQYKGSNFKTLQAEWNAYNCNA